LHLSPLYGLDLIKGVGPRYCPSIEDKVIKFAHNPAHQIFIEPEGWEEPTLYVGGFSTSLPAEIQLEMLHSLPGLEECVMVRAGYAVEYDMVPPTELRETLETRRIAGLYHCGQLNGTSGYEEAAAQGLVAGANAALRATGKEPLRLARSEAYIGTMIDDLITKGVDEPYRMLTSRAEHRIILRHDNADTRLTPIGRRIGLVTDEDFEAFERRQETVRRLIALSRATRCPQREIAARKIAAGTTVEAVLRRPEVRFDHVADTLPPVSAEIGERVAIEVKYQGYVRRQELEIERASRDEGLRIPETLEFSSIAALSREAREKLARQRPRTLGAASRIPGVNPADVAILSVHLRRPRPLSA
ncbi:MAG: tRNA uridine-5-carboxymethylaminomethyl(34) synthesis enzyme MnmG, partial [Candidatus Eremiobacteraeota bacterium]|nr:tRNA uridine-5-carboxymethylaminomethyl(34) synthesis enzyme MnmG [Candidatus Eremiobacteraeota bacterium]